MKIFDTQLFHRERESRANDVEVDEYFETCYQWKFNIMKVNVCYGMILSDGNFLFVCQNLLKTRTLISTKVS